MSTALNPAAAARVRLATFSDEEEILRLCRELHDENGRFPMCDRKVQEALNEAFYKRGGIIGLIGEPGSIEGCIFLRISQPWYSTQWQLEEYFNFVLPAYRRSSNANDLVEFAKQCADELKVTLSIGIISTERTQAKVKLYERRLGPPVGAFWEYSPGTAA